MFENKSVFAVAWMALLLASCQTASLSGGEYFKMAGPLPGLVEWKTINRQQTANVIVEERIPVGDHPPQNWTRLVGMASLRLSAIDPELRRDSVKFMKDFMERRCPGGSLWRVFRNDEIGILYERRSKPCRGQPEEHEVGRYVDGELNRFKVWYAKRVARMPDAERDMWIDYFTKAVIVNLN